MSDYVLIYDGTDLPVKFRPKAPGQPPPPEEVIKVRKCPAFDIAKLASKWGKELEEVAFYAGHNTDWAKTLDDDSYEAVLEEGRRLNSPSVTKYFARAKGTLAALGQSETLDRAIAKAVEQLPGAGAVTP